jgi:hypothetical protein
MKQKYGHGHTRLTVAQMRSREGESRIENSWGELKKLIPQKIND